MTATEYLRARLTTLRATQRADYGPLTKESYRLQGAVEELEHVLTALDMLDGQ